MPRDPGWDDLLRPLPVEVVAPAWTGAKGADPRAIVHETISTSGLAGFVSECGRAGGDVTLVVNDPQRRAVAPVVLDALLAGTVGRGAGRARILVATGSHAFETRARRAHEIDMLGPWRARVSEIAWHDARASADLVQVGPRRFHRLVGRVECVIGVGGLEPHYFAGCAGAHKTLTIGVMSRADIEANHRGAMSASAAPLALQGNPVFDGIVASLRDLEAAGVRLFAFNEIVVGGRLAACTAGPPLTALRSGLPIVRGAFVRRLESPVDLVVARVEPPLDRTLYQADKGIKNVEEVVADGGVILLEASCAEGVGADRFLRLLERTRSEGEGLAFVDRDGYVLGDHKAVRLLRLTGRRAVRVGIVSRCLPENAARAARCRRFGTRAAGAAWALRSLGLDGQAPPEARTRKGLIVEDAGRMSLTLAKHEGAPAA